MEKTIFPKNAISVILSLMVAIFVFEANSSVEFYFFGLIDDADFLFVGDEDVVLMCEARGFQTPTFKLTFNGKEFFDENTVVAQNQSTLSVNVKGSCLQLTINRLELSLNGKYICSVADTSVDTTDGWINSSIDLDVRESPQCRNIGGETFMVRIDCIHFRGEEVIWSVESIINNMSVITETSGLFNTSVGTNKMSSQLSQSNGPNITSYKCRLKDNPMSSCIITNNFTPLFKGTTLSPLDRLQVSSTNCSSPLNDMQVLSTNSIEKVTQSAPMISSSPSGTDGRPKVIPFEAIIVSIVLVVVVCLLITIVGCVYLKNRKKKQQEDRQEAVNHLFGGSVQINHHYFWYDYTKTRENPGDKTSVYDSIPQTTNQNEASDNGKAHEAEFNTEIPQSNPIYEASPSNETSSNSSQNDAPHKALSSDPIYDEAPNFSTKIENLDEGSGGTTKTDEPKKVSHERVNLHDEKRPTSAIYATVDRKSKRKDSESKASSVDKNTKIADSNSTDDHVYSYHATGMGEDASTRL